MESVAPRRIESWRGAWIAAGACLLSLGLSARLQALTGNSGMLLALLLSAAVASWFAGRWAGVATTVVAAAAVAYFYMPPDYSFRIADPHDTAALGSFAIGGVIISLLCGAAWQLRAEAQSLRQGEVEVSTLRGRYRRLVLQSKRNAAAAAASDKLLRQLARTVRLACGDYASMKNHPSTDGLAQVAAGIEMEATERSPSAVDCNSLSPEWRSHLPSVWADESELRLLFQILNFGSRPELTASRLPERWLFTATFFKPAGPLSPLQYAMCERIVIRQGGRCWAGSRLNGDWELRFLLPRVEGEALA